MSRDPGAARAGDVIFYLNDRNPDWPYHSMIVLHRSRHTAPGDLASIAVVYHTGPDGDHPGMIKKVLLSDLARHPNPRWHPVSANPYFLGVYRWKILD